MVELSEPTLRENRAPALSDDSAQWIPTLRVNNLDLNSETGFNSSRPEARVYNQNKDSMASLVVVDTPNGIQDKGSGFFVNRDGLLATAYHVVKNRDGVITVKTADGIARTATIVDVDVKTDQALLQVSKVSRDETFKPVVLGDSNVQPGQQLIGMGSPRSHENVFISPGQVSRFGTVRFGELLVTGQTTDDPNRKVIAADMHVETGQSGGATFDQFGRYVGMIALTDAPRAAIITPVEDLKAFIDRSRQTLPSSQSTAAWLLQWLQARHKQ